MTLLRRSCTIAFLIFALSIFSGCTSVGRLVQDKMAVNSPKVYDIYAISCGSFFTSGMNEKYPYCLAYVTRVTDGYIYLVSSDELYGTEKRVLEILRADDFTTANTNVGWHADDEIKVSRSKLPQLLENGLILETKRLNKKSLDFFFNNFTARPMDLQ